MDVSSNAGVIAINYQKAPALISTTLLKTMQRIVTHLQATVIKNVSGPLLKKRTGTGARSIFTKVAMDAAGQELVGTVGADLSKAPYMRLQNFGGTVVPRQAANLTIPVGRALTGQGVAKISARQFIENPGALGYKDSFFAKNILFGVTGAKGDRPEPVFLLRRSVTVPQAGYLAISASQDRDWINEQLGIGIREALKESGAAE